MGEAAMPAVSEAGEVIRQNEHLRARLYELVLDKGILKPLEK